MPKPGIVIGDRFSAPSQANVPPREATPPEPYIAPLVATEDAPKDKDKKAPKQA